MNVMDNNAIPKGSCTSSHIRRQGPRARYLVLKLATILRRWGLCMYHHGAWTFWEKNKVVAPLKASNIQGPSTLVAPTVMLQQPEWQDALICTGQDFPLSFTAMKKLGRLQISGHLVGRDPKESKLHYSTPT